MGLIFLTGEFPRDWMAETPNTIGEIRAGLYSAELPESLIKAISSILDQIAELMEPGDLLYKFTSPRDRWEQMMGTAGYVIVRNGEVVYRIMSVMN